VFILCGLALSLVRNHFFDFTVSGPGNFANAFLLVALSMVGSVVLCVIFGKSLLKTNAFQRLVLQDEQRSMMGYVSGRQSDELLKKTGIAKTDMRPSGKIEVNGTWYDAVAMDGFITRGSEIVVEKQENYNVFVRKKIS
jgi:membrane-bound serine protease (ClpP class)